MIKLRHIFYTTFLLSQSFISFGSNISIELSQEENQSVQTFWLDSFYYYPKAYFSCLRSQSKKLCLASTYHAKIVENTPEILTPYLRNFFSKSGYSAQKQQFLDYFLKHKKEDPNTLEFVKCSLNTLKQEEFSNWAEKILSDNSWLEYFNAFSGELKKCCTESFIISLKKQIEVMLLTEEETWLSELLKFVSLYDLGFPTLERKVTINKRGVVRFLTETAVSESEEGVAFKVFKLINRLDKVEDIKKIFSLIDTYYPKKWCELYIHIMKKTESSFLQNFIANKILEKDRSKKKSVMDAYSYILRRELNAATKIQIMERIQNLEQKILSIDSFNGKKTLINVYLDKACSKKYDTGTFIAIEKLLQLDSEIKPKIRKILIAIIDKKSSYIMWAVDLLIKIDPSYAPIVVEKRRSNH